MSSGYLSTVETRSRERRRIRRQRRQVIDPALPVVPRIPLGFIPQIDELDGPFTNPRTRRQFYRQPLLFWELDQIREMRAGPSQQRWYYRVNYSALDGNLAGEGYTLDWTMLPESDAWGWQRFDIRGFDIPIANTPWEETDGGWHISFEAGNEHQWTTFGLFWAYVSRYIQAAEEEEQRRERQDRNRQLRSQFDEMRSRPDCNAS